MRKFLVFCAVLLVFFAISGCSKSNDHSNEELKPIKVTIQIQPEKVNPNEEATIQALVTLGDEKVNDADEVAFEIQKQGETDRELIDAESKGEGIYETKFTFPEDGTYDVIAHVTARDMHVMPKKELVVGDPAVENDEEAPTSPDQENVESHEETGHEHGQEASHEHGQEASHEHGHGVGIELAQNSWVAGKESTLSALILYENAPLNEAKVRFEVWPENSHNHEYIDAIEIENGKYEASTTFAQEGKYTVKVHVEKDDIHDHKEIEIIVGN